MTTWPMLLDMSRDECKRILRRLELEAYGSLISALRAQGKLSKEKRKLLQDLASTLNISMERHRAEIRRAVNDEKLATIAEHIAGPNTAMDWAIEGRRLIPLMPRLVPQTAFTALANNVANIAAAENAKLPPPNNTVKKNVTTSDETTSPCEPNIPEATKTPQSSVSPVATGMMSNIQVKKDDESEKGRKRRRSSSVEGQGIGQPPSPTLPPPKVPNIPSQQQPPSRTVAFPVGVTPVKITLTTTPGRTTVTTTTSASTTQKVIIVSSSTASGSPSILQRSLSVPIVKTVSTTSSSNTLSQQSRGASLIINNQNSNISTPPHPTTSGVGNIVTISTNPGSGGSLTATTVSIGGIPTTAYITSQGGVPKIRPKSVQLPAKPRPRSGSIVIPVTPNQLAGGTSATSQTLPNVQGVQLKTAIHSTKPSLHIKQDSTGMKIMPISSVGNTTKILPKPSFSSGSQAPVYVMSATTASVSMVTRTVPASTAPRVVTLNTTSASGPNTVSHIRQTCPTTFITKNPSKPIQTVHIASQNPSITKPTSGKPNVIVVQKGSAAGFSRGVTLSHGGKEVVGKVIMSKSLSTSSMTSSPLTTVTVQKPATVVTSSTNQQALNLPVSSTQGNVIVLDLSQEQLSKNSVLAEILQASGILTDSGNTSSESVNTSNETSSKEWVQMDTEERHASGEVEMAELGEEETGTQNPTNAIENSEKSAVGEVDVPSGRVVTLEEAVELLGHSDSAETRALLSQAGIQVSDSVPATHQTSGSAPSSVQNSGNNNISQVVHQDIGDSGGQEMMEVIGELDPQTGIYSIHQPSAAGEASETTREVSNSAMRIVTTSASGTMDIFSTALASADINLDTFQYVEEPSDSGNTTGMTECSNQSKHVLHYTQSSAGGNTVIVESISKQGKHLNEQVLGEHLTNFLQPATGESTAVTVEPSNMDTTGMHIEDFTSQKVQGQDIT